MFKTVKFVYWPRKWRKITRPEWSQIQNLSSFVTHSMTWMNSMTIISTNNWQLEFPSSNAKQFFFILLDFNAESILVIEISQMQRVLHASSCFYGTNVCIRYSYIEIFTYSVMKWYDCTKLIVLVIFIGINDLDLRYGD